jgi:hypothetical protein
MEKTMEEKQKELISGMISRADNNVIISKLNLYTLNLKSVNPESADDFNTKPDYKNFIDFMYEHHIKKVEITERKSNSDHDGSKNTLKTTTNEDIEIYFMKGFNYNELNPDQKIDLDEILTFYDSIWGMRKEVKETHLHKLEKYCKKLEILLGV